MRVLVAGWFSFEGMGATAGDLMAKDLACDWVRRAGRPCDVALAPPFAGGVDWRSVDPERYSHLVFVCGPFGNGDPVTGFLERFRGRRLVGLNLTMLDALENWNPFDLLLERDSSRRARPDLTFLSTQDQVPVVGLILIHPQPEYRAHDLHELANAKLDRLARSRPMSVVPIDTRLDLDTGSVRTPAQVESLIARMDVVLTTRLHGMALALKNGVPVVAVDPVAGGAKIRRQAEALGWPMIFPSESVSDPELEQALDRCLTADARREARECGDRARRALEAVRDEFISAFA